MCCTLLFCIFLDALDVSVIPEEEPSADATADPLIALLSDQPTEHDDRAATDLDALKLGDAQPGPEEIIFPHSKTTHSSVHHQALHLPADPERCRACRLAKAQRLRDE